MRTWRPSLRARPRRRRRRRLSRARGGSVHPLAQQPGALAHQLQDLVLDVDLTLAGATKRAEELAVGREHRVGHECPNLEQAGDAALWKGPGYVLGVVGGAFDDEAAHGLRPGQRDPFGDVK